MKVLSLFDGMSCGQIALNKASIKYDSYIASEIDKFAISVTQSNFPKTHQGGDVRGININNCDLLMGGSPCQGFSKAGKNLNFNDPRSRLFFEFMRILRQTKPKYFLLENVVMKKEWQKIISHEVGITPVEINSSLVSAQNRKRLYWTNIPFDLPDSRGIAWGDIREYNVDDRYYYSKKGLAWIQRHSERTGKKLRIWGNDEKCQMIEASHYKNYSSQRFFGIEDRKGLRYITPKECLRAQTVPDSYAMPVSNTQKYKMAGNGWTIDVISHILSGIR